MAARCASCRYPLSVSDSVSCCECSSYFHIDCAQLVGFPYYELSSDPLRNIFHCQTCKILPLPRPEYSDSDSEDYAMPSRQVDCHAEGQPDLARDVNEIKGTVQDLSELCKDMFREIGELKSINLTLRCGIENLRLEGQEKDTILADLKRRIEALEGKRDAQIFKPINISETFDDKITIDKEEDVERFSTPDPEYARLKDSEHLSKVNIQNNYEVPHFNRFSSGYDASERFNSKQTVTEQIQESKTCIDIESGTVGIGKEESHPRSKRNVNFAEEETISKSEEENNEPNLINAVQDWEWKGSKAIHLSESRSESFDEKEDEECKNDNEEQGWEILEDELKTVLVSEPCVKTAESVVVGKELEEVEEKRVTWANDVEDNEEEEEEESEEEENEFDEENEEELILKNETSTEDFFDQSESNIEVEEAEPEEKEAEEVSDNADRTSLRSLRSVKSLNEEEGVEKPKYEEEIKIVEGDAEIEDYIKKVYTGRVSMEGSRLEGGPAEDGSAPAAEREGGQSPEQGEVQPSEYSEGSEPPPPQPQHSPDDLWDYLKESVSGEHPATVEEFVQKLIGTLEHVPEEYLKPVIDYNIKRATSPSVTDGEHLETKEVDHAEGASLDTEQGEAVSSEAVPEGEEQPSTFQESPVADVDAFPSEDAQELQMSTNIPEEPSETEGYPALEDSA